MSILHANALKKWSLINTLDRSHKHKSIFRTGTSNFLEEKIMFRKLLIILSLILTAGMLLFYDSAHTHSGRTDANGGHYNRKTGEYHYHNNGTSSRSTDYGEDAYLIAGGIIILIGICWILIDPDSCCLMDSEHISNPARSFLSERPTFPSLGNRFWLPDLKIDTEEMNGWRFQATYTFRF